MKTYVCECGFTLWEQAERCPYFVGPDLVAQPIWGALFCPHCGKGIPQPPEEEI